MLGEKNSQNLLSLKKHQHICEKCMFKRNHQTMGEYFIQVLFESSAKI